MPKHTRDITVTTVMELVHNMEIDLDLDEGLSQDEIDSAFEDSAIDTTMEYDADEIKILDRKVKWTWILADDNT